jgi:carboxyl-terminal processing protease
VLPLALFLIALPNDDFSKTWNDVSTTIKSRYYARETRKQEMDLILDRYESKAKAATSRADFETIVNTMISQFHDSHFAYLSRSDQGFYLMQGLASSTPEPMPEIGAWFGADPKGYVVKMVLDGGQAARVGLRKGDVVETIDGQSFSPIDSLRPKIGAEVTLGAVRNASMLFFKPRVESTPCLEMFLKASRDSAKIIEDHGRKIGYFHLWTQAADSFRNALSGAVYGKLGKTDGFILDLRDGFGGRPEGYADPFFRPDFWVDWTYSPKAKISQLFGYGRPLIVLINSGSRSAKEILSYAFKQSKRGLLLGRTTAGNVLGTFPQKVNDWSYLELPIVDVEVEGVRLEGKGVMPDVYIPNESDGNGDDMDMAAALDRMRRIRIYKGDPGVRTALTPKTTSGKGS